MAYDADMMRPARRYAEALFALAREKGRMAEVSADLAALHGVLDGDREAVRVLADRKSNRSDRRVVFEKKLMPGRDPMVASLLKVLVARRREALLPGILQGFGEAMEREDGLLRVAVHTATPLDAAVLAGIEKKLGQDGEHARDRRVEPRLVTLPRHRSPPLACHATLRAGVARARCANSRKRREKR